MSAAIGLMAASLTAHADFYGTASGRSANPASNPALSIEGFFGTGSDYQNFGVRVNFNVNERLTIYGDLGRSERFFSDGISFGGGAFFYLPVIDGFDSAVQASIHRASLDGRSRGFFLDRDITTIGGAFLISPKEPLNARGLNWYANAGLTLIDEDSNFGDSTEPTIGGGIYLPLGPGTFYAGADLIDDLIAGVGYRFGLR